MTNECEIFDRPMKIDEILEYFGAGEKIMR